MFPLQYQSNENLAHNLNPTKSKQNRLKTNLLTTLVTNFEQRYLAQACRGRILKLHWNLPRPVLTVVGLNAFQTIVSQMFVAMNKEIPDPRP